MATTIGSLDLNAFSDLYSDSTQYFWFESDSTATYGAGAHVTLVPDTSFISNPTGQNILMNTDGFSIRNGLLPMMTLDNDSLDFNVVDTTAGTYTTTATFTATGAQIGQGSGAHSVIDANGQRFYASNGSTLLANIGYGEGQAETGTAIAPYYTFGTRASGSTVGNYSMAQGYGTTASEPCTHAEGYYTTASGNYAHAEGGYTTASEPYAHAEGSYTTASGDKAHSEGSYTTASGDYAHAEGYRAIASGSTSHSEGRYTTASGYISHAEGAYTIASGIYSHAQNIYTVATESYQTVIGKYNAATVTGSGTDADPYVYSDVGDYAFIIGNGTDNTTNARSNAFTVDWNGQIGSPTTAVASTTITTFTSGWAIYNEDQQITLRRYGRIVSLTGEVRNTASKTLNTTDTKIFSLPTTDGWTEYLPKQLISCISHGSGANHFLFRVFPANDSEHPAEVTFARYTSGTSYSSIASGAWFPFHVTWIA